MANELMNGRQNWLDNFGGDDWFKNFGQQLLAISPETDNLLKTDVKETDKDYQLAVDLPGLDKKDIHVDYQDNTLKISAKRDSFADHSDSQGNIVQSERHYGRFSRQFYLPGVNRDQIDTQYQDGVLQLMLPKLSESDQPTNPIEIR
ncbi:Hsp20/alpha crystallin family protein [Latilactobacillus curvatus]|uniref:Hsp20/alpha crystallin family protein n=1 Tax=Latilactobacillus curvatus TaxID=28038 RepID=UPI0024DFB561|nr:Hsp20/alpha crystallin family protein [Latilactobacillus curvatus]WIE00867.1 Hsp20/alpha crystallin family protein [Latilactobacillus curvatus]